MYMVATGRGKIMLAMIYNALFPGGYILFVSSLVALMENQVKTFTVSAICLTAQYIEDNQDIWGDVAAGKYKIVMCAPEVASNITGSFWRRVAGGTKSRFRKGCAVIIIDEAHWIWS